MAGPFTTPVAESVPFLSEPERNNSFTSKNCQLAIEEAFLKAVANDVFMILAAYNGGNAGTGRHLEYYTGIDSEAAPLFFSRGSKVIAIVCGTISTGATCRIGFFDNTVSTTVPLYELIFTGQKRVIVEGTVLAPIFNIASGAELEIRVTSGSINKPHMQMVFSASTNGS